jgi:hypothetical protein
MILEEKNITIVWFSGTSYDRFQKNGFRTRHGQVLKELMGRPDVGRIVFLSKSKKTFFSRVKSIFRNVFSHDSGLIFDIRNPDPKLIWNQFLDPFPFGTKHNWRKGIRARLLCEVLKRQLRAVDPTRTVCSFGAADMNAMAKILKRKYLVIFDIVDNLVRFHSMPSVIGREGYQSKAKNALTNYQKAAECADIVFCNCDDMAKMLRKISSQSMTFLILNGVDYTLYSSALRLEGPLDDMNKIPRPRIGYVGILSRLIDTELLWETVRKNIQWSFVFVGKEMEECGLSRLRELPNFHDLGMKSTNQIPHYLAMMDVCLSLYELGPAGAAGSSMKMYEYLAAGRKIVALNSQLHFSEMGDYVWLCDTREEFGIQLQRAIEAPDGPEDRQARSLSVKEKTWKRAVDTMFEKIELLLRYGRN